MVKGSRFNNALLLPFLFACTTASAWGPTGHRVIGKIAEEHLTPKAKKAIEGIMGSESLAMASTYMDEVRSDPRFDHTHDWHWVTIPDGTNYSATEKNPNGDLIEAIHRMEQNLQDRSTSIDQKRVDLRFLVHLIGDLHQPCHIGRGNDRGGNEFQVRWMGKGSNLHRIWDSGIIDLQQLSYTELAESLDPVSEGERAKWQQGTIEDWAHEAMAFRSQIYAVEEGGKLGYEYAYRNWPLVREQLNKAAIRLAGELNKIFG